MKPTRIVRPRPALDQVAQMALELPDVTERLRHESRAWFVAERAFAWERPFRKADLKRFGDEPPPDGPLVAVRTADLDEKEAALTMHPECFFGIEHFDGYAAVLIQLKRVTRPVLYTALRRVWEACLIKTLRTAAPPRAAAGTSRRSARSRSSPRSRR